MLIKYFMMVFVMIFLNSTASAQSYKLPKKAKNELGKLKFDGDEIQNQICKDFRVNQMQVRRMFSSYKLVSTKEIHDNYDWLPCYIKGTIKVKAKSFSFSARAGHLLHTDYPDGVSKILAGEKTTSPSGK